MRQSILTTALALFTAAAMAAPPTEESVQTLLEVTKTESLLDQAYLSMEQLVRQAIAQQLAGQSLTDEQRRVVELAPARLAEVVRTELTWAKLRPIYVAIYQESFDQAEVDGLIEFYRSPIGQSFVSKMPAVMHRSMSVMQMQVHALMPQIQHAMEQIFREARIQPRT